MSASQPAVSLYVLWFEEPVHPHTDEIRSMLVGVFDSRAESNAILPEMRQSPPFLGSPGKFVLHEATLEGDDAPEKLPPEIHFLWHQMPRRSGIIQTYGVGFFLSPEAAEEAKAEAAREPAFEKFASGFEVRVLPMNEVDPTGDFVELID